MSCYLSFSDKEVFEGLTPPEGMPTTVVEEAKPHIPMAIPTTASNEKAAKEAPPNPAKERKCPKFPRWEKVLHPSWPVVVAGQPPHLLRSPSRLIHLWLTTVYLQRWSPQNPLPSAGIRGCMSMDAYSQFLGGH